MLWGKKFSTKFQSEIAKYAAEHGENSSVLMHHLINEQIKEAHKRVGTPPILSKFDSCYKLILNTFL